MLRHRPLIAALLLALSPACALADLADIVTKNSTDRGVTLKIIDSSDGSPETGVVYNTSGIDLWYRREGAAKVSITEASLSALTDAHSDGGFLHIGDGIYRLDLPDAAFAAGANSVDYGGTVTGMIVVGGRVRLTDFSLETALTSATINAAVEAGQVGQDTAEILLDTDELQIDWTESGRLDLILAAVVADTNELQSDDVPGLIAALSIPSAGTIADAVWDELTAGHVTAGSFAVRSGDTLTATNNVGTVATATYDLLDAGGAVRLLIEDVPTTAEFQARTLAAAAYFDAATDTVANVTTTANVTNGVTLAGSVDGSGFDAIPWAAAWDAEVESEVNDAMVALHLDHLLAADYDPSSKPGVSTALLNELVENDGGVSRFTANALEQAPSGGGGGGSIDEADADLIAARVVAARGDYYPPRQLVWVLQRGSTGITVRDSHVITKDADETLKMWIDFSGLLGRNEAVQSIDSLTLTGGTATKVSSSEGITGNLVYFQATGGADEDETTVSVEVTTTEAQVIQADVTFSVVD